MPKSSYALLQAIDSPEQLRQLPETRLPELADQLREYLVETVSETGGHLSAGLGTVELTLALHYVYNTPEDLLVWDVGHQTYPHKIITGRRDRMSSIRQFGGLSGFPKREENTYDTFGVGHSSTSVGAALGMSIANRLAGEQKKIAAIIGDGALTAGMAFEALNHAGDVAADVLVILNDNDMSISPNVGAMSKYLARMLSGKLYSSMRESGKKTLSAIPSVFKLAQLAEEHVKGMMVPGTLFEELGFNYIGPIDGHDLSALVPTLRNLRSLPGAQFLHVVTTKGKGYGPAEENPCKFHGVSQFNPKTGLPKSAAKKKLTYTEVFGRWICDMAENDPKLVGITPAMREGSGLVAFSEQFPERYFDVGIAEQHSVTLAAGLACEGYRPVVAIYSTFLQRAYDQLIHDVCIQNLPVLFAIDRAGIVGPDGPTHCGSFDLSFLRCIPNMVVMTPADERECRQMLSTGFRHQGPSAVRYPRGGGIGSETDSSLESIPLGKAELRREGKQVAILAFGAVLGAAQAAGDELDASVINMRFVKPLDRELLIRTALRHELLVTVEDNAVQGGAGTAVAELLQAEGLAKRVLHLGLPDRFFPHGSREELLGLLGLDQNGIVSSVRDELKRLSLKTIKSV